MVAGGVFRPIPSETPLGLTRHHPYDPFCNFKHGRNPIFAKVMAILTELSAKSGSFTKSMRAYFYDRGKIFPLIFYMPFST